MMHGQKNIKRFIDKSRLVRHVSGNSFAHFREL